MPRKGWDQLSANYRARLEKNGIQRSGYEAGESIQKARGHAKTPERPTAANVRQFPQYVATRAKMVADFEKRKRDLFGDSERWDGKRSAIAIKRYPPTMKNLRWALAASEEELIDALRDDSDTYAFIGYH